MVSLRVALGIAETSHPWTYVVRLSCSRYGSYLHVVCEKREQKKKGRKKLLPKVFCCCKCVASLKTVVSGAAWVRRQQNKKTVWHIPLYDTHPYVSFIVQCGLNLCIHSLPIHLKLCSRLERGGGDVGPGERWGGVDFLTSISSRSASFQVQALKEIETLVCLCLPSPPHQRPDAYMGAVEVPHSVRRFVFVFICARWWAWADEEKRKPVARKTNERRKKNCFKLLCKYFARFSAYIFWHGRAWHWLGALFFLAHRLIRAGIFMSIVRSFQFIPGVTKPNQNGALFPYIWWIIFSLINHSVRWMFSPSPSRPLPPLFRSALPPPWSFPNKHNEKRKWVLQLKSNNYSVRFIYGRSALERKDDGARCFWCQKK